MVDFSKAWRTLRKFLLGSANKEFLIFLSFLGISGFFWLFLTLNDTYEKEFSIPVKITGIPHNIVLTSSETDTIKMTIRDKGTTLITYLYGNVLQGVNVKYSTYARNDGTGIIPATDVQKVIKQQLAAGSKITAVKPERLEFFYNFGDKKKVPVRWAGRVMPEHLFFISHVKYWPDSVTVFAPKDKLDSINVVFTERLNYANFRDTLIVNCQLAKTKGVKTVPEEVKVGFFTDVLTEESIDGIPVKGINVPEGKIIRTFPAKVSVKFVTGASVYPTLRPEDFSVVIDYNEVKKSPSEKCRIILKATPPGISHAQLETPHVDYLIEQEIE